MKDNATKEELKEKLEKTKKLRDSLNSYLEIIDKVIKQTAIKKNGNNS